MKKDQERHTRYKEDDKLRKWAAKKKKKVANNQEVANVEEVANVVHVQEAADGSSTSTPVSEFSGTQSLHRSLSKADLNLPKSPNNKTEIIQPNQQPNTNFELICRKIDEDLARD